VSDNLVLRDSQNRPPQETLGHLTVFFIGVPVSAPPRLTQLLAVPNGFAVGLESNGLALSLPGFAAKAERGNSRSKRRRSGTFVKRSTQLWDPPRERTRQAINDVGSWNRFQTPFSSSPAILMRGRTALQHLVELPGRMLGRLLRTLEAEIEVSQGMIWREAERPFSRVMLI
jgi:hypothetical protein